MRDRGLRFGAAFAGAVLLASCAGAPRQTFDLEASAPRPLKATQLRDGTAAIIIDAPRASAIVDTDRIVIRSGSGELSYLEGAQWSDVGSRLVQARLIEALRKCGVDAVYPGAVGKLRLGMELQRFEIDEARGTAVVEISARLADESSGARLATAIFVGEAPTERIDAPSVVRALDAALERAAMQIAGWSRRQGPGATCTK